MTPGDRRAFARDLGQALREIGFAILVGHGIDPALYAEAEERVTDLFTKVPLEEKMRFRAHRQGSVNQGYFPIKESSDIHPDLVEGWVFCRRAYDFGERPDWRASDFWPRPDQEPFFRRLASAHEALILPVMQSLLMGLGCDEHLYDTKLTRTNFGQRLNYYPPLSAAGRGLRSAAACSATRTWTSSPSCPLPAWKACRPSTGRT